MKNLTLFPGDVILFEHAETGLYRWAKERFLGSRWGHVSIFWGIGLPKGDELICSFPVAFPKGAVPLHAEAIGRGTLKTNLLLSSGRYIKVLRHAKSSKAHEAAVTAGELAREGKRWYDYQAIARYVIPYLLVKRLTGKNVGFGYYYNDKYICSEMVDAAYGYTLFDDKRALPTLPGDYEYTSLLKPVWEGYLTLS